MHLVISLSHWQIQGDSTVCQSATELLSAIGSIYTKNIVVKQPGISRFLLEEEEGVSILAEMTAKFEVYIDMAKVRWEPLEDNVMYPASFFICIYLKYSIVLYSRLWLCFPQDILELAFKMTHCQNFQRSSSANFIQESNVGVPNGCIRRGPRSSCFSSFLYEIKYNGNLLNPMVTKGFLSFSSY
jgi:hypothetical protein